MLLSKVKKSIEYRVSQYKKLPEDDVLQDFIQEATIYVADSCDPTELTKKIITTETILKMIENDTYIVEPEYPDFSAEDRHLNIDEILSYAVINYTCFLISGNEGFKTLTDKAIASYVCEYSRVMDGEES